MFVPILVLLASLGVLVALGTALHSRLATRPSRPLPAPPPSPAPAPLPAAAFDPGLGSAFTDSLRRLVRAGVARAALDAPLPYVKDAAGVVHADADCGGVTGPVSPEQRSPLSLPVNRTCSCADEVAYLTSSVRSVSEPAESLLVTRRQLRELSSSRRPGTMAEALRTLEDSLLPQLDSDRYSLPALVPLRDSVRTEVRDRARELRSALADPAARAVFLEDLAVRKVVAVRRTFSERSTRILSERAHSGPAVASTLHHTWREARRSGADAAAARSRALTTAMRSVRGPVSDQLDFEPTRPRRDDQPFRDWVLASWRDACTALLGGLVDGWEEEVSSLAAEPPSVLLGFERRPRRAYGDVLAALELFRVPGEGLVCFVPSSVASWLSDQGVELNRQGGVQRVPAPDVTAEQAETAAALWSPGSDGPLATLSKSLEAARVV